VDVVILTVTTRCPKHIVDYDEYIVLYAKEDSEESEIEITAMVGSYQPP